MRLGNEAHIAVVVGTRPNFVKAAPFLREAQNHPEFRVSLIHTGQHYDANMSRVFFEQMGIPAPHILLQIEGKEHTEKIGKMFNALKTVFATNAFDGVVVFGDVNSTLAGAIAASKNHTSLLHVESGLRSHDRRMPEEIIRVIVDHHSDVLFTSEPEARLNLKKEGIDERRIVHVGNIMIESLELFWDEIQKSVVLERHNLLPGKYFVATIHRQENTDDPKPLKKILDLLGSIADDLPIVFPLHPGTQKKIEEYGFSSALHAFTIIEPLGYFDFVKLMSTSAGVITDSGGIQEETSHLGIPCATLRDNTERPITIVAGSNKLFAVDTSDIEDILMHLRRTDFRSKHIPYWDSHVSSRIFEYLCATPEIFSREFSTFQVPFGTGTAIG